MEQRLGRVSGRIKLFCWEMEVLVRVVSKDMASLIFTWDFWHFWEIFIYYFPFNNAEREIQIMIISCVLTILLFNVSLVVIQKLHKLV